MTTLTPSHLLLTNELSERCARRAPVYGRENRFFTEDFEELKQAGYLRMPISEELGGLGMSLAEVCREQRRLACHAPALATIHPANAALAHEIVGKTHTGPLGQPPRWG